jgi:AraC-like DNA-binding protein
MAAIQALSELIERSTGADGVHPTAIRGLRLARASQPGHQMHGVHEPSLCIIASGEKRVLLADEIYTYRGGQALVASVDLPVSGQVVGASPEAPYLSFVLRLDVAEVAELASLARIAVPSEARTLRGIFVTGASETLIESAARLVSLLHAPSDIPVLAPLAQREILYRLLCSEHGHRVAQLAASHGHAQRVRKAIEWLQKHFAEPLQIESFARDVNMSPSSLHHHFKAVTAMSPLQYQKQLRLQEARRLLLAGGVDAATAGHRVGYESPSQFSREYSRLFGEPPGRDLKRLRSPTANNWVPA